MSRQKTRARQRQQVVRSGGPRWPVLLGGAALLLAVIVGLGVLTVRGSPPTPAPTSIPPPTLAPTAAPARTIDGIPCLGSEQLTYHVHAHLTILEAGKPVTIPQGVGINYAAGCLYWLHTHDTSGIIHIEAPYHIKPVLKQFFDIWGQPLSATHVDGAAVRSGQSIRVYVNQKPFTGSPRDVPLYDHESVTIEIGPPFQTAQLYDFQAAGY